MDSSQPLMDQNRGPSVVALLVVLMVISAITVMLRIYSRLFVRRGLGWDDGMMVVAVVRTFSSMHFQKLLIFEV